MQKTLKTLGYLTFQALPLLAASPVAAKDAAPQDQTAATKTVRSMHRHRNDTMCRCQYTPEGGYPIGPMGAMHEGMGGMGDPGEGTPIEIMFPQGPETSQMTELRHEMQLQHQKMQADHARMHELMEQMKELRKNMKKPKTSRAKGNSAPSSPLAD